MKYLKTYHNINESKSGYLTLDDFTDMLSDITDNYEHKIEHVEDDEEYYDCWIYISGFDYKEIECIENINHTQFTFLQEIAHSDRPSDVKNMIDYYNLNIKDSFDAENSLILDVINHLQNRLEFNKKIYQILENFEHYILPRFMEFKNFKKCTIGFESFIDVGNKELLNIRISFDIKLDKS